jgi:prepilin-type processing-associated H-X9-DG protein
VDETGAYPAAHPGAYIAPFSDRLLQRYVAPLPADNYRSIGPPGAGTQVYLGPVQSVWVCPAYNAARGRIARDGHVASYGYNGSGCGPLGGAGLWGLAGHVAGDQLSADGRYLYPNVVPTKDTDVVAPAEMIAVGDAVLFPQAVAPGPLAGSPALDVALALTPSQTLPFYNVIMRGTPAADPAVRATRERHDGRWNVAFCDGHVGTLAAKGPHGLFDVGYDSSARRWNIDDQPHNYG